MQITRRWQTSIMQCLDWSLKMPNVAVLSDLYKFIIQEARVPQGFMLSALQQAARAFFDDTEVWKETLDPHRLVAEQRVYELEWDWCARVQRIEEVRWNTEDGVEAGNLGTLVSVKQYDFDQPDILTFNTPPDTTVDQGLEVDVIYVPTLSCCEMPQWILNRWAEPIWAKALSTLLSMPRKAWSDPARANFWKNEYNKYQQRAIAEKDKMNKAGNIGFTG